jgi:hypothetical protein
MRIDPLAGGDMEAREAWGGVDLANSILSCLE